MTNLVINLHCRASEIRDDKDLDASWMDQAADEIEQLEARVELLEKAITIIGSGLSRTAWGPKLKDYAVVHREHMDYALLTLADIQFLYAKYPDVWREVPKCAP